MGNIDRQVDRMGDQIRKFVFRTLQQGVLRFQARMIRERLSGPTGPASLSRRTGQLARSIRHEVLVVSPVQVRARVFMGGGVPYAGIHERGGIIRPRGRKNLAIPIGPARTRAGVGLRPAQGPNLKLVITKGGGKLLARIHKTGRRSGKRLVGEEAQVKNSITGQYKTTAGNRIEPWFVLKPFVRIPARLGFRKTWGQEAAKMLDSIKVGVAFLARSPGA